MNVKQELNFKEKENEKFIYGEKLWRKITKGSCHRMSFSKNC